MIDRYPGTSSGGHASGEGRERQGAASDSGSTSGGFAHGPYSETAVPGPDAHAAATAAHVRY